MKVKISVIIPIYNGEKYLRQCLNSCIDQSLTPIEIICIDDGSTDNSRIILDEFAHENDNVIILSQENKGSGEARNAGLKVSRGEYVAFMDSDDYYPLNCTLKLLYDTAKKENVNICGGKIATNKNNEIIYDTSQNVIRNSVSSESQRIKFSEYQCVYGYSSFIFNRIFLEKYNIVFPDYRRFQDPPFMANAMIFAEEFYSLKDVTYIKRITSRHVVMSNSASLEGIIKGITDILELSANNNLEILHGDMVEKFTSNIENYVYKSIWQGNDTLEILINKMFDAIDDRLLMRDSRMLVKPQKKSIEEIDKWIDLLKNRKKDFVETAKNYEKILIYGAGTAGKEIYRILNQNGLEQYSEFVITQKRTDYVVFGKIVNCIYDFQPKQEKVLVVIGNKDDVREMEKTVKKLGFTNIYILDYDDLMFFQDV